MKAVLSLQLPSAVTRLSAAPEEQIHLLCHQQKYILSLPGCVSYASQTEQ